MAKQKDVEPASTPQIVSTIQPSRFNIVVVGGGSAGIAVAAPMLHLPIEEFERQMDVNVTLK